MTATQGAPLPPHLTAREELTVLAYRAMRFPNMCVDAEVWALTPLDEVAASDAFIDLIDALQQRDGLADSSLSWVDTMPDATGYDRDGQAKDAAMARVEDALDALLSGAR